MRKILTLSRVVAVCSLGVLAVACGSDDSASDSTEAGAPSETPAETAPANTGPAPTTPAEATADDVDLPTIVVTTNILGDIVSQAVGDLAEVEVIMPIGADPHQFAPSARQAESMENADLLVVNGEGLEDGMTDIVDQVESSGTAVFTFAEHIDLLEFAGEHSHDDEDHAHDDEEKAAGEEDHDHSHSGDDPHIWTDPSRMAGAVEAFGAEFASLDGVDAAAAEAQVQAYVDELVALDAEMEQTLSAISAENRVMVTNHEAFGYFADRFGFEVAGTVIPSMTTSAEPSAADIEELVDVIEREQVPAIFAETTQSSQLAEVIADSVGTEVAIVQLYTGSLGESGSGAETYIDMMSTNATLIADALAPA